MGTIQQSVNQMLGTAQSVTRGLVKKNDVSEDMFQIWLKYSQSILEQIASPSTFYISYLQVILSTMDSTILPYQKLSMCLKYLISILPLIK